MLAIRANHGHVFISNSKHTEIAFNTEQQIHCCSHELYLKKVMTIVLNSYDEWKSEFVPLIKCFLTVGMQGRNVLQNWSNLRLLPFVQNPQEEMLCVHQQGVWNFLLSLPNKKRKYREKPYLTATTIMFIFISCFSTNKIVWSDVLMCHLKSRREKHNSGK